MTSSRIRESVLLLVACAVGAGSLLIAGSALAEQPATALFRIEQRWHGFPDPAVTANGAGMYQGYLIPYYLTDVPGKAGVYVDPPATAKAAPFNPVGGPFTLPKSFFTSYFTGTLTPKKNWPGYTTTYFYHVYNGPGKFAANNGPTAPYRMYFPTTGGNPVGSNYGTGNPNLPTVGGGLCADGNPGGTTGGSPTGYGCGTTTFNGRYDLSRGGELNVTPGANRFGGTFRLFFLDTAHWDQYISYVTPFLYEGFGSYFCFDDGKYTVTANQGTPHCTPDAHVSEPGTTAIYKGIWWLLTAKGDERAITPTAVRQSTYPTLTPNGSASYIRRSQHYLNLIHPWTTGAAFASMPGGNQGTGTITPMATGYDTTFGGSPTTLTIYKKNYNQKYVGGTVMDLSTTTSTPYTQVLKGVTRAVSLVRPRLTWTIMVPTDPVNNSITNIWAPVRMRQLKVFFLPEPAGMLMLGVGGAALLGLMRMRRR